MSLPDEVRAKYIDIIDEVLADADLTTISAKAVRKSIQAKVEFDITPHKTAINDLIGGRFDVAEAKQKAKHNGAENPLPSVETPDVPTPTEEPTPTTNGVHKSSEESGASPSAASSPVKREADDDDLSDVIDDAPPKKKRKAGEEDDAAIAARLQAEENRKARSTRGGVTRKSNTAKKKKTPKKKSKNRIASDEDSDVNGEDKPKVKKNTGFHKPLNLSSQLSALLGGAPQMSRPEVTSALWKHIKGNNLQDPTDKRHILCDAPMREVFKTDRVHMFQMTKIANQHMYNPDE